MTIYLNKCDTIQLSLIGNGDSDKWIITYDQPDSGYYLDITTNFSKVLTTGAKDYYLQNNTNLNRSMRISLYDASGNIIETGDFELKFYYDSLEYSSLEQLGLFVTDTTYPNKLDFKELINKYLELII